MLYIWNICRLFMSAFKRTAPSDEAMRVAPIQGQLGPPPLQSKDKDKPPGTILRQFDAPKMHRTTKLVSQSKRCTNVWRLGANLPLLLRKGNHASIPIDMKVWRHCDHWPSDKSVSLRLRICALLTWRIQLVSCEQAGTASWQWFLHPQLALQS